jgi:hypothetical protein
MWPLVPRYPTETAGCVLPLLAVMTPQRLEENGGHIHRRKIINKGQVLPPQNNADSYQSSCVSLCRSIETNNQCSMLRQFNTTSDPIESLFLANQEIYRVLGNPKVHHCIHTWHFVWRCVQGVSGETRVKDHSGNQDVGGRAILRWIFRKWEGVGSG